MAEFGPAKFSFASPDGRSLVHLIGTEMVETAELGVTECHGMSLDAYDSEQTLWIADNGHKFAKSSTGQYEDDQHDGQVVRVSFTGERLQTLTNQDLPTQYREWHPTGVSSEPHGEGRLWVADGYGRGVVHCFDRDGNLLWTTDGHDSGKPFDCPHAIVLDTRSGEPELLVADRGNRRIVVLNTDGAYIRAFGEGALTSPSGFALSGKKLIVTELYGALAAFDEQGHLAWRMGKGQMPQGRRWPNTQVGAMTTRPPLATGTFQSPHGVAVGRDGVIAIAEWLIGGRLILLTPIY